METDAALAMSTSIRRELLLFLYSACQGCLLHVLYDLIRGFRMAVSAGKKLLAVTDFLYWIFCGVFLFLFALRMNQGLLRSYLVLGPAAGAILWNRGFSAFFVKIWSRFLSYPIFLVKFFRKRLLFLLERGKILSYRCVRRIKKGKKVRLTGKRGKRIGNS